MGKTFSGTREPRQRGGIVDRALRDSGARREVCGEFTGSLNKSASGADFEIRDVLTERVVHSRETLSLYFRNQRCHQSEQYYCRSGKSICVLITILINKFTHLQ